MSMKLSFASLPTNVLHPSKEKQKRKKENSVGSIDSAAVAMWFSHHKVAKIVCKVSYAGLSPQLCRIAVVTTLL